MYNDLSCERVWMLTKEAMAETTNIKPPTATWTYHLYMQLQS